MFDIVSYFSLFFEYRFFCSIRKLDLGARTEKIFLFLTWNALYLI